MILISPFNANVLAGDACQEIQLGHDRAWQSIQQRIQRSQWEPHFVAHLCASMAGVASKWRTHFRTSHPGISLTLTVVFTHQSPYVTWSGPPKQRCELADLLIAFIDHTAGPSHGVATLIQAKQSDNSMVTPTTPSERKQFALLSQRPIFDVDASQAPLAVDLSGRGPDVALLYGLTPPDQQPHTPPGWPPHRWQIAGNLMTTGRHVSASRCLAETLVDLLLVRQGWRFNIPSKGNSWRQFGTHPGRDDWSMLINYLFERSFKTPVNVLRAAGTSGQRREEHKMWLTANTPSGNDMFVTQDLPDSGAARPLSWITGDQAEEPGWIPAEREPTPDVARSGDGDQGHGDQPPLEDAGPENGPISAVVLEFHKND